MDRLTPTPTPPETDLEEAKNCTGCGNPLRYDHSAGRWRHRKGEACGVIPGEGVGAFLGKRSRKVYGKQHVSPALFACEDPGEVAAAWPGHSIILHGVDGDGNLIIEYVETPAGSLPEAFEPTMTREVVQAVVAEIADMADCDGEGHKAEDELHRTVLRAIADGHCDDPAACAAAALQTLELGHPRWYE